jgi:serine protease
MIRMLLPLLILLAAVSAGAATINVPADYATIGAAIAAAVDGDLIQVAAGTYSGPDNRVLLIDGINLRLIGTDGAASTIIDCEGQGTGVEVINGAGPMVQIQGFTIRNASGGNGSALIVHESSAAISDCIFESSTVTMNAGAVWIGYTTDTVTIDGCEFHGNSSVFRAGALMIDHATADITDCIFADNTAGSMGGGGMFFNVAHVTVHGCILTRNDGGGGAGGIASDTAYAFPVTNTIIANSTAGQAADSGIYSHCISWNNFGGDDLFDNVNNLTADPLFCDPAGATFYVCEDSPAAMAAIDNPWGETVGCLDQGCSACGTVANEDRHWGAVKSLYR